MENACSTYSKNVWKTFWRNSVVYVGNNWTRTS